MTNIEKLIDALSEWGMNVVASILPNIQIPPTSTIGRVMSGFFGLDVANYNIYNELGFLLKPTMKSVIKPILAKYLEAFDDNAIKEIATEYAEAMHQQAIDKGYVNLFGIQIGANAFADLKEIINSKMM